MLRFLAIFMLIGAFFSINVASSFVSVETFLASQQSSQNTEDETEDFSFGMDEIQHLDASFYLSAPQFCRFKLVEYIPVVDRYSHGLHRPPDFS